VSGTEHRFLASCPRGFADLLAREIGSLGASEVRERSLGVSFTGDLVCAYRACLESRVASRVFLEIARFEAASAEDFHRLARDVDWTLHVDPRGTIACDFTGRHPAITHTQFGAQRLKDAIVDRLRDVTGVRPDVETRRPSVRVHAHAHGASITLSLDLSGEGLHARGYRLAGGEAPLRENVAAGMLLRAGWPSIAAAGGEFLDPLCGSGTIVIEAALIAADIAPGLRRDYFGFLGWRGHDASAWAQVRESAQQRAAAGLARCAERPALRGLDRDARVLDLARANAERAGVAPIVSFAQGELGNAAPALPQARAPGGLLATNPPYGVRLEDRESARAVHRELGRLMRERFAGWSAAVITGSPDLGLDIGLRAERVHTVWNGAIECRLLRFDLRAEELRTISAGAPRTARIDPALGGTPGARMFANRLQKNLERLGAWARREGISCYRLYDADMPEYAFAIDLYASAERPERWLYVQEYAAPAEIETEAVQRRRGEALAVMPEVTGVPADHIHVRTRRRTPRGEQYEKRGEDGPFHEVEENGLRFLVNFTDYLDTGLFLDHRLTRARIRDAAERRRFLNLFGYTGTATVYAAAGRARATTTVDLSRTYLEWAQRNLALNGASGRQHRFERADCREWLEEAARRGLQFDLIFLDPPTFSSSKRMHGVLDTQRDHAALIDSCLRLLARDGLLVFSTNAQRFRLDPALPERYDVRDISKATLPRDFERNPRIHTCYEIRRTTQT
jgi:23S rRNA (guanine2445-N2)-methyltransferase / 23S rRNA (guanine2069-N7)-methyltransferase